MKFVTLFSILARGTFFTFPSNLAPSSTTKDSVNSRSPLISPVAPIVIFFAVTFPSTNPKTSTFSALISPITDPFSFMISDLTFTGPFTEPPRSTSPAELTSPSMVKSEPIVDFSTTKFINFS